MDVYRDCVIDCLEHEELISDDWERDISLDQECVRCLLGQLVFNAGSKDVNFKCEALTDGGPITPFITKSYKLPKSWPNCLSFMWEQLCGLYDVESAKDHMIDWVMKNVPDEILFEVNDV